MHRSQLQELSRVRLKEARVLSSHSEWAGSYYLAGYAAECALKACIARNTRPNEFPDRKFANAVWTHDLTALLGHAGLELGLEQRARAERAFEINCSIVKDWSEHSRYETNTEAGACDLVSALTARKYGILPWIRRHW